MESKYYSVPAIFLDRDGVINNPVLINNKPYATLRPRDAFPIKGIKELIAKWKSMGFVVIVITNQPDIARGTLLTKSKLKMINTRLQYDTGFDDIFVCPHDDKDKCLCRKPNIDLFLQARDKYHIDFESSWMIGDRAKDIEAAKNVGCKSIFVDYDYDEPKPTAQDYTVKSILEIKNIIKGYYE